MSEHNSSPNKSRGQNRKKDYYNAETEYPKEDIKGFGNLRSFPETTSMQAFLESNRSLNNEQKNQGKKKPLEKEQRFSNELTKKSEEVARISKKQNLLEEQLRILVDALQDKKLQIQNQLISVKENLDSLEEEEDDEEEDKPSDDENWELKQLVDLSIQAKEHSYSPYSKFRVGCILKTTTGEYYKGCNVENASYGLAICAERTALVKAVSEGHKKFSLIVINSDLTTSFCAPCGACRQFMSEFGNFDVYLTKPDKTYIKYTVNELLPYSFSPDDLDSNREGM